ncbi:hypothetical protein LTR86_000548 [Recurvomyces mirabilis]|nr:hypothetical protein LTR86_000548 [Recurvomyces mirabilis]
MSSPALYVKLMFLCNAATSLYGGYQSYIAITNLKKYEETSKKLAEWSSTAAGHLQKTRTTQGAGAIAVLLSLIISTTLAAGDTALPFWFTVAASPAMLVCVLGARQYIKGYWNPNDKDSVGTRIPLPNMEGYNEAQRRTEEVLNTLQYLEYGWVATTFIAGMAQKS